MTFDESEYVFDNGDEVVTVKFYNIERALQVHEVVNKLRRELVESYENQDLVSN